MIEMSELYPKINNYIYTVPVTGDLARIASLGRKLRELKISHENNGHLPAFSTKKELYDAMVAVYKSNWSDKWCLKEWVEDKDNDPYKYYIDGFIADV